MLRAKQLQKLLAQNRYVVQLQMLDASVCEELNSRLVYKYDHFRALNLSDLTPAATDFCRLLQETTDFWPLFTADHWLNDQELELSKWDVQRLEKDKAAGKLPTQSLSAANVEELEVAINEEIRRDVDWEWLVAEDVDDDMDDGEAVPVDEPEVEDAHKKIRERQKALQTRLKVLCNSPWFQAYQQYMEEIAKEQKLKKLPQILGSEQLEKLRAEREEMAAIEFELHYNRAQMKAARGGSTSSVKIQPQPMVDPVYDTEFEDMLEQAGKLRLEQIKQGKDDVLVDDETMES